MLRRKVLVFIATLLVITSLLPVFTGCSGISGAIVGSGNLITQEMDFTDFTKLEIGHVFQARVTRADSFSVSVTVDDNLLEYVTVRKSGKTLSVSLEGGYAYIGTTKIVEITMPGIDKLSLSGGANGIVSGFSSLERLELEASGASTFYIDDMKAGDTSLEVSGASRVSGDIEIAEGRFDVSGASSLDLEGYARDISLEASGASHASLVKFSVSNAAVDISGASVATVNASGSIDGNVSGASRLTYLGNPALAIEVSSDSTVGHR